MIAFWKKHRVLILDVFVLSNLAFLAVDIYFAHSINPVRLATADHVPWGEWIPFVFSLISPALLIVGIFLRGRPGPGPRAIGRGIMALVGAAAVVIGVLGMYFHLHSQFFQRMDLQGLVYTAPFMAPLSYAGLGFLLLLNVKVDAANREWGQWIVFFALGGFFGNFVLALCDHAQNGFFYASEWIPVIASAVATGFLMTPLLMKVGRRFWQVCAGVMGLQIVTGMLGFYLHFMANYDASWEDWFTDFVYGAPIFAPLLFADIAVLGFLGIYDLMTKQET